ncbi:MAG TPA: helix-turn-helix domain-containing protein [Candidatus Hypogeohydataceae bacterium YC41]
MDPLASKIGNNIKKLRTKNGLSAQEFCKKVGITRVQSLYEYEKGLRIPKAKTLYNISVQFGLSMDSLFDIEEYVQVVSTSEDIARNVYEWEEEIRGSSSGVVGLRKVVLPFFSRIHRTEFSNIVLEEQRGNPDIERFLQSWRKRVELFESGNYVSHEICYLPTIMDYCQGKGKCHSIPLEERVSQLELVIKRLQDYPQTVEIRVLESPAKISFVLYGKRLILNGENSFFVSRNPSLVKAFHQEFALLWERCLFKDRKELIDFLGGLAEQLKTGRIPIHSLP